MPAFDRVRGQREWRAGEADERDASPKSPLDLPNRLQHVGKRFARIKSSDPIEVCLAAQRAVNRRTFAVNEVERDAHRFEWQQQIGKQDRGVHLDAANGLERDFGGEIGGTAEVEEGVPLAQRAIFAHVSARLAHEPDWRGINGLSPASLKESAVRVGQWVAPAARPPALSRSRRSRARPTRSSSHIGLNRSSAPSCRSSLEISSSRK